MGVCCSPGDNAVLFFSDPHIGAARQANTTPQSSLLWQDTLFNQASLVTTSAEHVVCGGDLFDHYSNRESVLLAGMYLASQCDLILGGNHDVVQDKTKTSSFELLASVMEDETEVRLIVPKFDEVVVESASFPEANLRVTLVPHHTTQDLFYKALLTCHTHTTDWMTNILLLHCNYESPHDLTETSLNLTEQQARELLEIFDYILLGHEHQPRDLLDGRLRIIGNTFPTSFSDISDKRVLIFEDGELRSETIWSEAEGSVEMGCHNIVESLPEEVKFVEVTGEAKNNQLAEIARSVSRMRKNNPHLLAVKLSVEVEGVALQRGGCAVDIRSLPQLIEEELADSPDQLEMWREVTR